jgi:hypothetical protein
MSLLAFPAAVFEDALDGGGRTAGCGVMRMGIPWLSHKGFAGGVRDALRETGAGRLLVNVFSADTWDP